jgi:hypothetical protein
MPVTLNVQVWTKEEYAGLFLSSARTVTEQQQAATLMSEAKIAVLNMEKFLSIKER